MNKIILALVCVMVLTAVTTTALTAIELQDSIKEPVLKKEQTDTLKDYNGVDKVEVNTSDFECIDNVCYTTFYQEGLINSKVGFQRQTCTEINGTNETSCTTKTDLQLEAEMDVWLKKRLEGYADVQKDRATKGIIKKYVAPVEPIQEIIKV